MKPYCKYILSLLNSKLYNWLFSVQNPSIRIGGGYFSINSPHLLKLPYREPNKKYLIKINELVDNLTKNKNDNEHSIKIINDLIYKIYDLNTKEIEIIDMHYNKFNNV